MPNKLRKLLEEAEACDKAANRATCGKGPGTLRKALEDACHSFARFTNDDVVTAPGRKATRNDYYEQWADKLTAIGKIVLAGKLENKLEEMQAEDDLHKAAAIELVILACKASRRKEVTIALREIAKKQIMRRSVISWMRRLPEVIWPSEMPAMPQAEQERLALPIAASPPLEHEIKPTAQPRQMMAPLDRAAIGILDKTTCVAFKLRRTRWEERARFRISKGIEESLLRAFAEGEGYLAKKDAISQLGGVVTGGEAAKLMKNQLKPAISRLRSKIKRALRLGQKDDPLPWQEDSRGWRAAIQIGYAISEDNKYAQSEDRPTFKLRSQLA